MKRVLITGGAGFLGLHLARRLLDTGHHVDLLDNLSRGLHDVHLSKLMEHPQARLLRLDLLNSGGLRALHRNYDRIFHFAALVGVTTALDRPFEVLQKNVEMIIRLLEFARDQTNLERFVFSSTSEVYAGSLEYLNVPLPAGESTPLALTDLGHPRTSYMLSKIYGEALCRHAGVPFTIVRPHNCYGPRMGLSHVIPELLNRAHHARAGDALEVFSPLHRRTFCFVDDAVEMIRLSAEARAGAGATLNIGNQEPEISMTELAALIGRIVGKDLQIVAGPVTPGSPARRCPDMARTIELTGYRSRTLLDEGVERTYRWYRTYVFDGQGVSAR